MKENSMKELAQLMVDKYLQDPVHYKLTVWVGYDGRVCANTRGVYSYGKTHTEALAELWSELNKK